MQGYFAIIDDPRHDSYVKHNLGDILTVVLCAVMCGMDTLGGVVAYGQNKEAFLREKFGIESIPSKATLSRVLSMVDGQKVAEAFIRIMRKQLGEEGEIIAIDGKTIRSTAKAGKPGRGLQIITAYVTSSGVILGQEKVHEKTNEIPVARDMLSYLNLNGKLLTADAMHCQRKTCALIVEKGGDYVLGLKENQKALRDDAALFFAGQADQASMETYETIEKNGGRVEKRRCKKLLDASWLVEQHDWPGLRTVFAVERETKSSKGTTRETSYYITSSDKSAKDLLAAAREHWRIESMHWMLDAVFTEDACRLLEENAHLTLNAMRKYALAIHKRYLSMRKKKTSMKRNMTDCLLNDALLLEVILAS